MEIVRNNIDELNATITLSIIEEDYASDLEKALKNYQKKADIKGFRKGKVPIQMITKLYGANALVDIVNKLISSKLYKYIVDNNINILGEPLPSDKDQGEIDWKKDKKFSFTYDIGLAPEFEIGLSEEDKLQKYKIKVDDDMIAEGVEMHKRHFGKDEIVEVVSHGDLLRGDLIELEQNNPKEDGIKKYNVAISLHYIKDEKIKEQFIDAKQGDAIVFDLKKAYPNATDLSSLLEVKKEEIETLNQNFQFIIKEISHFAPHEVNQELFTKLYGEDTDINSEEKFKAKVKEEISAQLYNDEDYKLGLDAKKMLQDKLKFNLPEKFLKRWLVLTNKDFTEEMMETNFSDKYAKEIRWQLIKSKIVKDNDLKVEDEEIKRFAKQVALMQLRQYGMMNVPDDHLDTYVNNMLEKKEDVKRLHDNVEEDKVIEYIKSKVSITEQEIIMDDFRKMLS